MKQASRRQGRGKVESNPRKARVMQARWMQHQVKLGRGKSKVGKVDSIQVRMRQGGGGLGKCTGKTGKTEARGGR